MRLREEHGRRRLGSHWKGEGPESGESESHWGVGVGGRGRWLKEIRESLGKGRGSLRVGKSGSHRDQGSGYGRRLGSHWGKGRGHGSMESGRHWRQRRGGGGGGGRGELMKGNQRATVSERGLREVN